MRTIPLHRFLIALAFATVRAAGVSAQIDSQRTPAPALASLAGVVRDSTGAPMADAEVMTLDQRRTTHTGADGRFTLADIPPGSHDVLFRKLGYTTASFTWLARFNERTDVAVTLRLLPHTLDPVVVRAQEDKKMRGRSAIVGFVVDSLGNTIAEAEVQLIGADRIGVTRENGGFAFRQLPVGQYLVRVRKLGYEPNVLAVELQDGDERELAIKIRQLPTQLDPVVVSERSGYGGSQAAWDDLDARQRWRSGARDILVGSEDLRRFGGMRLDLALTFAGVPAAENAATMHAQSGVLQMAGSSAAPVVTPSSSTGNLPVRSRAKAQPIPAAVDKAPQTDADTISRCLLINGTTQRFQPLRAYSASDVDLVEVYPSFTDPGGLLSARMTGRCRVQDDHSLRKNTHPTWYVLWLRNAK